MRIVGGSLRGRRLRAPAGVRVRPTGERVRESLFDILLHGGMARPLEGAHVVDLFAGTGALGLEALSRGAASLTAVESEADVRGVLRANIEALGCADRATVVAGDATRLPPAATVCDLRICWIRPIAPASRRRRSARWWKAAGWTMRRPSWSSTGWTIPSSRRRRSRCRTSAATAEPRSPFSHRRLSWLSLQPARHRRSRSGEPRRRSRPGSPGRRWSPGSCTLRRRRSSPWCRAESCLSGSWAAAPPPPPA